MQRTNAKDDAVGGGENGERPPSSQPIAPAVAGQAPPQPAEKSIAYFLRIADETREAVRSTTVLSGEDEDCGFIFSALVKTHNDIIRTIRDIPPWEWGGEFLRCEPELLHFLDQNRKRHPECPAFNQAHILASALSLYHRENKTPKPLTEQERTICIAANRDLVDEYSDALLRTYREIFNFLFKTNGNTTLDTAAAIIGTIKAEHERTRQRIEESERRIEGWRDGLLALFNPVVLFIKWVMPRFKSRERSGEITQEQVALDFGVSRETVNRWEVRQTANGPENKSNKYGYYRELRTNPDLRGAYYELMNCVKRYQAERRKAAKTGRRFVTFVRFHEEWLKHRPYKM